MLTLQPIESAGQRIREEFERIGGGLSAAAFANHCINVGVWSEAELSTFVLNEAKRLVKYELGKDDARGLPFAGQTAERDDDGAPVWKQRVLWDVEAYGLNSRNLRTQGITLIAKADLLDAECTERFGVLPFTSSAAD